MVDSDQQTRKPGTDRPLPEALFADRIDAGRALGEQVALCRRSWWAGGSGATERRRAGGCSGGTQAWAPAWLPCRLARSVPRAAKSWPIGAVAPGGVTVLNGDVIAALHLSDEGSTTWCRKAAAKWPIRSSCTGGSEGGLDGNGYRDGDGVVSDGQR